MANEKITVLVPVLNEEKYIGGFLKSLLRQDYPENLMEVLFLDGGCRDDTIPAIKEQMGDACRFGKLRYRILKNPGHTAPCAMNLGIREAAGEILVRMDVHRIYPSDYISKCVYYLITTDADNVGCPVIQKGGGKGLIGRCIAEVLTSDFGVGASAYRKGNRFFADDKEPEYVDTVPLGTFRKDLALKLGGFDERYPRAEDNDFNYRIRKAGGKILLFKEIHTVYYCRSSVAELIHMGYGNGGSIGAVFLKEPRTVSIRHFVPLGFVISLAGGSALSHKIPLIRNLLKLELSVYAFLCAAAAVRSRVGVLKKILLIPLFPILHISYGIGTAVGLVREIGNRLLGG
ncbi:MAG: glycosyltransferase family 2 protein [Lachnospiraceae bacterium]|nr:glycosyltransferase family 2 protein [Lachnospiraceae bacterium]